MYYTGSLLAVKRPWNQTGIVTYAAGCLNRSDCNSYFDTCSTHKRSSDRQTRQSMLIRHGFIGIKCQKCCYSIFTLFLHNTLVPVVFICEQAINTLTENPSQHMICFNYNTKCVVSNTSGVWGRVHSTVYTVVIQRTPWFGLDQANQAVSHSVCKRHRFSRVPTAARAHENLCL